MRGADLQRWREQHPERHQQDYERRVQRELPKIVVAAAAKAYQAGTPLHELARRFRVHPYTIRAAMTLAGVAIRPAGGPRKPKSNKANRIDPEWEAKMDRALAAEEQRRAARLARLRRRCECGGIVSPDVAHHCGRVA